MTVLIFFSPDTVLTEIQEKANAILSGYNVDSCKVYDVEEDGVRWLGYEIEKDRKIFIVKMEYAEDASGQLAIKNRQWKVVETGELIGSGQLSKGGDYAVHSEERVVGAGFASLGEVFTMLSISKR